MPHFIFYPSLAAAYFTVSSCLQTVASLGLVSPKAVSDWCHPIFSWKKSDNLFLVIASESDVLSCCRLLTIPIFPRRLSSVFFSKFSHKKINFRLGVNPPPPGGYHPGRSAPAAPSDATHCLQIELNSKHSVKWLPLQRFVINNPRLLKLQTYCWNLTVNIQHLSRRAGTAQTWSVCNIKVSHSFTCHPHTNLFRLYSHPQGITALWLVLTVFTHEGMARLSWPGWLCGYIPG